MTFGLWARRASRLLHPASLQWSKSPLWLVLQVDGGGFEPPKQICSRFTVCPLWPLGNPSIYEIHLPKKHWQMFKPMIGLEPITCWLQISCSANWATSAGVSLSTNEKIWGLQGSNLWPSACKAGALPAELRPHIQTVKYLLFRSSLCYYTINCRKLSTTFFNFFKKI